MSSVLLLTSWSSDWVPVKSIHPTSSARKYLARCGRSWVCSPYYQSSPLQKIPACRIVVDVRDLGPITYKRELETDVPKLVASASGVVVEIGPGNGNQLGRYDKKKVTKVSLFCHCMDPCSSSSPLLAALVLVAIFRCLLYAPNPPGAMNPCYREVHCQLINWYRYCLVDLRHRAYNRAALRPVCQYQSPRPSRNIYHRTLRNWRHRYFTFLRPH